MNTSATATALLLVWILSEFLTCTAEDNDRPDSHSQNGAPGQIIDEREHMRNVNTSERNSAAARRLLEVPAIGVYDLRQPTTWFDTHEKSAGAWYIRAYNPSVVRLPESQGYFVYSRISTYARCPGRQNINHARGSWSRVATCKANTIDDISSCKLRVWKTILPQTGGCGRLRGVEDVRLFSHRGMIFGIGAFRIAEFCSFRTLLLQFDPVSGRVSKSKHISGAESSPRKNTKNWAVIPHRYNGLCDDCILVMTRPMPLEIGILNLSDTIYTPLVTPPTSIFATPKAFSRALPYDLRGSSGFIPAHNWFPKYRTAYVAMVHFSGGWGGQMHYFHLFVLLHVKDDESGLPSSTFVSRTQPFFWDASGTLRTDESSTLWKDRIQFGTSMECVDESCSSVLISYGRGDCSGHIVHIETWRIREMFRFE